MLRGLIFILGLLCLVPVTASAQQSPSTLLADVISYDANADRLIASGNVEVLVDGRVIRAQEIVFYNQLGQLEAKGPLTITQTDGTVITADAITLDENVQSGLVQGARIVLAENFQIAANELRQISPSKTAIYKGVASGCVVCGTNETPLWLVRAERILRDQETLQVHFQNARFEAFGVTIGYLPYFRIPDPSLDRATGLLTPSFSRSDFYGYSVKMPYFIAIASDKDVTITPFFTSNGAAILEGEYRQRFENGGYDLSGAIAFADGTTTFDGVRGFLNLSGNWELRDDFKLNFDIIRASDKGFMRQFGFSQVDRLRSEVITSRQRGNAYISLGATAFQSLRDNEPDSGIPNAIPQGFYERYWDDIIPGGRLTLSSDAVVLTRAEGRDVAELGVAGQYTQSFQLPFGILGKTILEGDGRLYTTRNDANFDTSPSSVVSPLAAIELRWPLIRRSPKSTQIIEPVVQAVYSDQFGDTNNIPNEDSETVEFDAANLFALNRYPGNDARETGLRFNIGANYTRLDADGWSLAVSLGQIFRSAPQTGFSTNTGLNEESSNIVAAINLDLPPIFELSNQSLFDADFAFSRNDVQASLELDRFELETSYVYLASDPLNAIPSQHEINLKSRYKIDDNWAFDASWRRNLATGDNVSANAGLEYGNECIRTRFSVSRRFTESASLPPGTDFGLEVRLAGFGGGKDAFRGRNCVEFEGRQR
jgi:LPS-assembly protein